MMKSAFGKKFLSSIGADCHSAIALKTENDFFFGASISAEIYGKKIGLKLNRGLLLITRNVQRIKLLLVTIMKMI